MSHRTSDALLKFYADVSGCAVISAGYRLAPEHPFPAGPEDCFDVAEYLVKNAEKDYGGPVKFMGGEVCGLFYVASAALFSSRVSLRRCYFKLRDFNEGLSCQSVLML
jgi:acetyl esterase/lipase